MNLKKTTILVLTFLLTTSCSFNRSTIYKNHEVALGSYKNDVVKKFGKPFKESMLKEQDNIIEIYTYKESVYVGSHEYIVSTLFYFKNMILTKKEQIEENPYSDLNIKVKD